MPGAEDMVAVADIAVAAAIAAAGVDMSAGEAVAAMSVVVIAADISAVVPASAAEVSAVAISAKAVTMAVPRVFPREALHHGDTGAGLDSTGDGPIAIPTTRDWVGVWDGD